VGDTRLEQSPGSSGKSSHLEGTDAESDALGPPGWYGDPDLARLSAAWSSLSESARLDIMKLVNLNGADGAAKNG
jgi:hypothetical protein